MFYTKTASVQKDNCHRRGRVTRCSSWGPGWDITLDSAVGLLYLTGKFDAFQLLPTWPQRIKNELRHQREVEKKYGSAVKSFHKGGTHEKGTIHGAEICLLSKYLLQCIKVISHSRLWAIIYIVLFEKDEERSLCINPVGLNLMHGDVKTLRSKRREWVDHRSVLHYE